VQTPNEWHVQPSCGEWTSDLTIFMYTGEVASAGGEFFSINYPCRIEFVWKISNIWPVKAVKGPESVVHLATASLKVA
jgi:hypothetical protein